MTPITWHEAARDWAAFPEQQTAILVGRCPALAPRASVATRSGDGWTVGPPFVPPGFSRQGFDLAGSWVARRGDVWLGGAHADDVLVCPDDDNAGAVRVRQLAEGLRLAHWISEGAAEVETFAQLREVAALLDPACPWRPCVGADRSGERASSMWPECLTDWAPVVVTRR
jgi:hypothetical protein